MEIHTIFVEPANYTQDLICHIHQKRGISYSFLKSNSQASNNNLILATAKHVFDKNSFLKNINFLWYCSNKYDLIIINGYNHFSFIILWLLSFWNPFLLGIDSDTPFTPQKGLKKIVKHLVLNTFFSNSKVIGLSGGSGKHIELFTNYGMAIKRIFLMPMMIDNDKFYSHIKNTFLPNNSVMEFIFVGRLVAEKNIQLLIKSFNKIVSKGYVGKLTIVGNGTLKTELIALANGNNQIVFEGNLFGNGLITKYKSSDVLILPSNIEPWGLVVNEALCANVAVICSNKVGAVNDLIIGPNAGWVFQDNNQEALEAQLIYCINNPIEVAEKATNGHNFMKSNWNYKTYENALDNVIAYVENN